jgi:16S rRNA (guanine966-N2)-methyltransferase
MAAGKVGFRFVGDAKVLEDKVAVLTFPLCSWQADRIPEPQKRMRVIAGKFRSRPLRSLRGLETRPTSDRLRETLFDVLTAGNPLVLEGSVWFDLFAGTGAVGIEALSRGAAEVFFVESAKRAVEVIRRNLSSLGLSQGFYLLQQPTLRALRDLEQQGVRPSFVFLDPPYQSKREYRETFELLGNSQLGKQALVIAEHYKRFDPGEGFGFLHRTRRLEQGDVALSFYRRD